MRVLEERIENEYAKEEWQPSDLMRDWIDRQDLRDLSDKAVAQLVRKLNAENKRNGSYIRYRSVEEPEY